MRRARTVAAWFLLIGSIIGWPLAAFGPARDEPQFVLGLSFMALIIESASLLTASQVRENQQ